MTLMTTSPTASLSATLQALPRQFRDWLDSYGNRGWIAATIVSFIFCWPLGLAFVGYITLTRRWKDNAMFGFSRCCKSTRTTTGRSSGNSAFDAYKEDTLRRLEEEQAAFEGFMKRLRDAKDKQEFDSFMAERARPEPKDTAEA